MLLVALTLSHNPSSNFTPLGGEYQCMRKEMNQGIRILHSDCKSYLLAFQNEVTFITVLSRCTYSTYRCGLEGPVKILRRSSPRRGVWQCTGSHTRRNCGGKIICLHLLLFHCGLACRFLCLHCVGFRDRELVFSYRSAVGPEVCFLLFFVPQGL